MSYESKRGFTLSDMQSMNPNCKIDDEVFVDIEGYEGLYKISNWGNVWNSRTNSLKVMDILDGNYWTVELSNKGQQSFSVHYLVCKHFCGHTLSPEYDGDEVNHKDSNRRNPYYKNLEFCNHLYNIRYAIQCGNKDPHAPKPTLQIPIRIRETGECFRSQFECAEKLGIPESTVGYCKQTDNFSVKYQIHFDEISIEEYNNYISRGATLVNRSVYDNFKAKGKSARKTGACPVKIKEYNLYFKSFVDCERYLDIHYGKVSEDLLLRKGYNPTYGVTFEKVSNEDYLNHKDDVDIDSVHLVRIVPKSNARRRDSGLFIKCIERNLYFKSCKQCDTYFGFYENAVSYKLKNYSGYFAKYDLHFIEVSEEEYNNAPKEFKVD